jgi:hypothetical protein
MAGPTFPSNTNDTVTTVTAATKNGHAPVTQATAAAVLGSGKSVTFSASYDFVWPQHKLPVHLHFRAGQTITLAPDVQAALVAAGAPMTVNN